MVFAPSMHRYVGEERSVKLLLMLALIYSPLSFALKDVFFGPEFTFAPAGEMLHSSVYLRMYKHLVTDQPEDGKFRYYGYRGGPIATYTSPNGWSFRHEPELFVVEVQMSPLTPEGFQRYAGDMQDAIFVSAANE